VKKELEIGDWVKFSSNDMTIIGEIKKPMHKIIGEENEYFIIQMLKPRIELSFRRDKIKDLKKIEPPLFGD
jgi:hypothetical protein